MADKNKKFGSVAEDLFSTPSTTELIKINQKKSPEKTVLNTVEKNNIVEKKSKIKNVGRPASKDIKNGEETIQTSIYLTEETKMQLDIFAIKTKMDRSAAIRYLIRNHTDNIKL